jgi:AraC family transcriptional activator of pobA
MEILSPIPIYNLQQKGKDAFDINHVIKVQHETSLNKPHRDENYILAFQDSGRCEIIVDFNHAVIEGAAICCILPGQVHHGVDGQDVNLWVVAVDPELIQRTNRQVFMDAAVRNRFVSLSKNQSELIKTSLKLLDRFAHSEGVPKHVLHSMLDACLGLFVMVYQQNPELLSGPELRPATITRQFRNLLMENFRTIKAPKDYAALLNISPSYLNEVVRETSGYPVSHWIHQEIILEAKRVLYYTDDTVKEIATNLGYTDVPYFIRLFGKITGIPPIQFRLKYRR